VTARAIARSEIERANSGFWNELCGTRFAQSLGITDSSAESLARYDHWYFSFYPHLEPYVPFAELAGKRVLEVGLGLRSYRYDADRRVVVQDEFYNLDFVVEPSARHRSRGSSSRGTSPA
jgi:hypothetical protein